MPKLEGTDHWCATLTPEQVKELRRLHYDVGICMACAAKVVGVNRQTAYDAITFRTWRSIEDAATT